MQVQLRGLSTLHRPRMTNACTDVKMNTLPASSTAKKLVKLEVDWISAQNNAKRNGLSVMRIVRKIGKVLNKKK